MQTAAQEAHAAVVLQGTAATGFARTIGNRLQIVADGGVHVLHRAGDQRRLHLGIGVVLIDVGANGRQVVFPLLRTVLLP
jgi:hypothetical protein